jgi:hypothetical protein
MDNPLRTGLLIAALTALFMAVNRRLHHPNFRHFCDGTVPEDPLLTDSSLN